MERIPIHIGAGPYEGRSKLFGAQRFINLFPTPIDHPVFKVGLFGTPGLTSFVDLGTSAVVRGLIPADGYLYAVSAGKFFQVTSAGVATDKGDITTTTGQVSMCWTGTKVVLVDGTKGWTYTPSTDTFAEIVDTDFPTAEQIVWIDGYSVANDSGEGTFYISANRDATDWAALDYATAEGYPDDVLALLAHQRELWLPGNYSTEVWYHSGAALFPFNRRTVIPHGIAAPGSIAGSGRSVFWLGRSLDGMGTVYRATDYQAVPISTPEVSYHVNQITTISDAIGYTTEMEGQRDYILTFPSGGSDNGRGETWAFNLNSGLWHERKSQRTYLGQTVQGRHRSSCHAYFPEADKHIIGDFEDGLLYTMDLDVYEEGSNALLASWITPTIGDRDRRLKHPSFEVLFEPGVGLTSGQGSDPQSMMKRSNDGGFIWSDEAWGDIGKKGKYDTRVIYRRQGSARRRVYNVMISDPVKRAILGAYAEVA